MKYLLPFFVIFFFLNSSAAQSILFVDSTAIGANNGTTWADAYTSLSMAIDSAVDGDSILVATGTYLPDTAGMVDHRDATFLIRGEIKMFGGFPSGGSGFSGRNPAMNPTILSGNIGDPSDSTDNVYHVIAAVSAENGTIINGFIVESGYSEGNTSNTLNGQSLKRENGAGIYIKRSSILLDRMHFRNNFCVGGGDGGAIYIDPDLNSDTFSLRNSIIEDNESFQGAALFYDDGDVFNTVFLTNCKIRNNESRSYGGAIKMHGGGGSVKAYLDRCEISGNTSINRGGAFATFAQSTGSKAFMEVTNSIINENFCDGSGGIMRNDCIGDCDFRFINCTFVGNSSSDGDLIYNVNNENTLFLNFVNCIFWDQSEIFEIAFSAPDIFVLTNCIYPYDTLPSQVTDGGNNILAVYPEFVDSMNNDFRLDPCSPAVDAGVADSLPVYVTKDFDGNNRVFNGQVDIGAYEADVVGSRLTILYVDSSKNGDGSSWNDAFGTLTEALEEAGNCALVDTILLATGIYRPIGQPVFGFQVKSNIQIIGGFPSGGGVQDINLNPTVLSGDIGIPGDSTDNASHVLSINDDVQNSVLEGITLRNGQADGGDPHDKGGALYCLGVLTLKDVLIEDNYSDSGGPVNLVGSEAFLTLIRTIISGNSNGDGTVFSHDLMTQLSLDDESVIEP